MGKSRLEDWREAIYQNDAKNVQRGIDAGFDLNAPLPGASNPTPLYLASTFGCEQAAQLLVEAGADVSPSGNPGDLPISIAAYHGYVEIVQLLLDHGAKPRDGLASAARGDSQRNLNVVRLLTSRGADVHELFDDSKTPAIHLAAGNGDLKGMVTELVRHWFTSVADELAKQS